MPTADQLTKLVQQTAQRALKDATTGDRATTPPIPPKPGPMPGKNGVVNGK